MRCLLGLRMRHQLTPAPPAAVLGVLGNISRDQVAYPGGRTIQFLGGAALHGALAATRAGLPTAPVAVVGQDLEWITRDPRLADVDLSCVKVAPGKSCAFGLTYDVDGRVVNTTSWFGVTEAMTSYALSVLGKFTAWHVCCRRPLAATAILDRLAEDGMTFSVDFHLASARALMPRVRAALPRADAIFVNAA